MDAEDDVRRARPRPPPLDIPTIVTNNAGGQKTPTPGPSSATGGLSTGKGKPTTEKEKKLGHRRITEGGNVTYKKIETSQIMGSIQLGIQQAIGGLASKPERDLLMQDFMTVEQTYFASSGSNSTPAHHYSDFRFKTYAPIAFRYFRDLFGIQPDDFLMSLCSVPLRELSNPGASGSIFYLTDDDEFIIKTVMLKECDFLQKLLPGYYMNLNQNPRTLLPKFFGLYCYQCNSKNVRLCAMNNLLPSSVKMHQKYDLKGSTYKRKASKAECQKAHPTYKDLDFLQHHPDGIFLEADTCAALIKTMQRDCRVLESFKIMDYSLLVGIHNLDIAAKEKADKKARQPLRSDGLSDGGGDETSEFVPGSGLGRTKSINRQKLVAHSTALESIQAESEPIDAEEDVPPGGIPARNAKGERLLLFLGLIDILQSYRLKKKLEHTFKAMIHDGDTVSVHRPGFYAERFMNFMTENVFKKIPSLDLPEIKGNHRKFRNLVSSYLALKHSPSKKRIGGFKNKSSLDQPDKIEAHDEINGNASTASIEPLTSQTPSNAISKTSKTNTDDQTKSTTASATSVKREASRTSTGGSVGGGEGFSEQPPAAKPTPIPLPSPRNYPSVLTKERQLPGTSSSTSSRAKVPPPVPPRTPKRGGGGGPPPPTTTSDKKGVGAGRTSIPFDTRKFSTDPVIETVSASDVYVETLPFRSSLSVASSSTTSGVLTKSPPSGYRNTDPSWTEGTPSYTTSSSDSNSNSSEGCPETPVKRNSAGELDDENETQMTHL